MTPPSLRFTVGPYTITCPVFHHFGLDGGGMFGSAPKALWQRWLAADEKNRIPLASRSLLITDGTKTILVDVGLGTRWSAKYSSIFDITPLHPQLPSAITDVIVTHLHFDHAGGLSSGTEGESVTPTFPQATVYVSKKNRDLARTPPPRERASYLPYITEALDMHTVVETSDGQELFPGISVHSSNGHTEGLQWIKIHVGDDCLLFPSDVIPTSHHLHLGVHMGYDMCAREILAEKKALLTFAHKTNATVVFQHDRDIPAVVISQDSSGSFIGTPV